VQSRPGRKATGYGVERKHAVGATVQLADVIEGEGLACLGRIFARAGIRIANTQKLNIAIHVLDDECGRLRENDIRRKYKLE
jgi:hypothetical protein